MKSKTLDLGCGKSPRSLPGRDAFGIDLEVGADPSDKVLFVDLITSPIPFVDNSFERVFAHDFLEHVPRLIYVGGRRRQPFIELLNDVWRVLRHGGVFESCTPLVTDLRTWAGDPTHVNPISENTFNYFCAQPGVNFEYPLMKRYGFIGEFKLLHKSYRHGTHIYVEMEVVK